MPANYFDRNITVFGDRECNNTLFSILAIALYLFEIINFLHVVWIVGARFYADWVNG